MPSRLGEALIGLLVLVFGLAALVWALWAGRGSVPAHSQGYSLYADFEDASGIRPGTVVDMAGVPVGRVTGVALNEFYQARVQIHLEAGVAIPEASELAWRQLDLLAAPRLTIVPFALEGPYLQDGDFFSAVDPADNILEVLSNLAGAGS